MKKLLLMLLIGYGAWNYYQKHHDSSVISNIASDGTLLSDPVVEQRYSSSTLTAAPIKAVVSSPAVASTRSFRCDGRQYCSQMTSCAEATYFLQRCPGTKMDGGDGQGRPNGVPCERQWCH